MSQILGAPRSTRTVSVPVMPSSRCPGTVQTITYRPGGRSISQLLAVALQKLLGAGQLVGLLARVRAPLDLQVVRDAAVVQRP